jgi:hypothetical protein
VVEHLLCKRKALSSSPSLKKKKKKHIQNIAGNSIRLEWNHIGEDPSDLSLLVNGS